MSSSLRQSKVLTGVAALILSLTSALYGQSRPESRPERPPLRNSNEFRYAYEHGYRAGYEYGYDQGRSDFRDSRKRDFAQSDEYRRADRTYQDRMGKFSEYQDGYHIGFELAYNDGYFGRPYTISVPANIAQAIGAGQPEREGLAERNRREPMDRAGARPDDRDRINDRQVDRSSSRPIDRDTDRVGNRPEARPADRGDGRPYGRDEVFVGDGQVLRLKLTSPLNTKTNREGDRFTARVVEPENYLDATVTGHVARINRSGRSTGKTEMSLAFDEIVLADGRRGALEAQVERVYESENVKTVDEEGNVQTGSRTKDTTVRSVGGAALGAIIGGIAGGGKGAAIGAILGAGAGAGSVYVQGNKDLILETGTEMLIRSNARQK